MMGRVPRRAGAVASSRPPFRRVLVANRGEIAVRIIRACRELGIETVAVYSDADAAARHVRLADVAVRIGPPPPTESYLRIETIVEAARATGADAVHPGYGFLSERAAFARAVEAAGLVFVGPPPAAIEALGDKLAARRLARSVGVEPVPGTYDPAPVDRPSDLEALLVAATEVGFPLLVKAAAGGGGRGMRRVTEGRELAAALASGSAEARSAFGDGAVYLEREIRPARHIEVQLLGDRFGNVVALGERDCSIQRRHQKLVEEAPAPGLTAAERRDLHARAVALARAAGLSNAATVEFLRDASGRFWFLEVNARLQVEHPVTELVSGIDLVHEQLRLAAGAPLSEQVLAGAARAVEPERHAIEVRISAEDPGRDFVPTPGRIDRWQMPAGPGVRVDSAVEAGARVPPEYDNLIAKCIVVGPDRATAIARLRRALEETEIGGIQTTLPFHRALVDDPAFEAAELSTDWVALRYDPHAERERAARDAAVAAGLAAVLGGERGWAGEMTRRPQSDDGAVRAAGPNATPAGSGIWGTGRPAEPRPSPWRRAGREASLDRWPR